MRFLQDFRVKLESMPALSSMPFTATIGTQQLEALIYNF